MNISLYEVICLESESCLKCNRRAHFYTKETDATSLVVCINTLATTRKDGEIEGCFSCVGSNSH